MAIINNLNGDKVEFTGVSRVWNNTKYDFEEIYFGDKQIFSIWAELESTLPITIHAAGEALTDYKLYGNTVGGESVGERTEQLFNLNRTSTAVGTSEGSRTGYTFNLPQGQYTLKAYVKPTSDQFIYAQIRRLNETYSNSMYIIAGKMLYAQTITISSGDVLILFNAVPSASVNYTNYWVNQCKVSVTESSTASASYIPYGYKLPMVVTNGTATTTTPIYIGENQLGTGEYVSYSDGKIYRMVGGTLTPTDPPAPIPAMPTIEGETIIDYNPSETPAVEPEKIYTKYRKEGF